MKKDRTHRINTTRFFALILVFFLAVTLGCAASGGKNSGSPQAGIMQPMEIPENVSCGKCGMYPAQYPRWQSQIIFKDGSMTPFDGCKCMFNFLFAMAEYDKAHSRDDVSVSWVKDFNSGTWINAEEAFYVVGSKMMGPMGKELIPFSDQAAAMKFHQEQGGTMMNYAEITPGVLKSLGMEGMKMEHGSKHMKM